METQQFCLKWNSHQANMLTVFEQLLSTEALVDVTLACDGLSLKAHKVVLSACSPYFQSLFVDNPCKHPIVIMKDMRYSDLKAIIDFMYKGEVNVSHDQLNALLKTAETLKVKGLAEMSGENRAASAGAVQQNTSSPPPPTNIPVTQTRSDSPAMLSKRKHGRPRKRFRSGSVHSDEEIVPTKIKEPESPEIEELPQDPSDSISDSIPVSSKHQTPVHSSAVNNSHLSRKSQSSRSSHQTEEPPSESDFSIEPSKLMEQTLTTTPVISNGLAQSSSSGISVNTPSSLSIVPTSLSIVPASCESQLSVATDSHSSNQTQGPDSPQDVKPLLSFEEPLISVDPSQDGSSFMDSSGVPSIAGTSSSYQEDQTALVPQDSQSQDTTCLLKSTQGHNLLFCSGYMFRKEKTTRDKIIWKCCEYHKIKCSARVHTCQNTVLKFIGAHNHQPPFNEYESKMICFFNFSITAGTEKCVRSQLETILRKGIYDKSTI